MTTNEFLVGALDVATQVKFSYVAPGNESEDGTLNHFRDYFGVVMVQNTSGITMTMPTTGFDTTTRNYLRHFINKATSTVAITLDYGYSTVRLEPGEGVLLFWAGTDWQMTQAPGHQNYTIQGRIELGLTKTYMIQNGDSRSGYINDLKLNSDSGTAVIKLLVDGVDKTGNLTVTAGAETAYTLSPTCYLPAASVVELDIVSCVGLEGLHFRVGATAGG